MHPYRTRAQVVQVRISIKFENNGTGEPRTVFPYVHSDRFESPPIHRGDGLMGRDDRHLVFGRHPTKKNANTYSVQNS